MCKKITGFLVLGLILALVGFSFSQSDVVMAKEVSKVAKQKDDLTTKQVLDLAVELNKTMIYVQRGGDYKAGEYKKFSLKGKTYRYLSSSIDTKKELVALLGKSLDRSAAEQFIKDRGIFEHKGKLAQLEADGGSILNWEKATAQHVKTENKTKFYRLTVPLGISDQKEGYILSYQYSENVGWRINKEPELETHSVLNDKLAVELATRYAIAESYVQSGGSYVEGEYKTFVLNGKTHRYLSSKIDTKNELLVYLKNTMTAEFSEQFIKEHGIIEHKGKLAQVEADGGSTAQWAKSKVEHVKSDKNTWVYRLTVPFGNTGEEYMYLIEYQQGSSAYWKVSKAPYLDLNIPGNVNPAYIFFNYLLVDSNVAKNQFLSSSTFKVDEFKKGIKKVEMKKLVETDRSASQVEFMVKLNVELEKGYKGPLVNGENILYFYIQPTGYMKFKIARIGMFNFN